MDIFDNCYRLENQSKKIEDTLINTHSLHSEHDSLAHNPEDTVMLPEDKSNDLNQSNHESSTNLQSETAQNTIVPTPDLSDGSKPMEKCKDKIDDSENKTEETPKIQTSTKVNEKEEEEETKNTETSIKN